MVIELKDIGTVKFQCQCGASQSFNPDGELGIPEKCHQCGADLLTVGSTPYRVTRAFMESLKKFRDLQPAEQVIRLTIPIK
jgi:hypothetical protein